MHIVDGDVTVCGGGVSTSKRMSPMLVGRYKQFRLLGGTR
jgi:hypothetical protein